MRMTAAGVVRERLSGLILPLTLTVDHGSTWNARTCEESSVGTNESFEAARLKLLFSLCPVDAILTRMGAYDNMFSNSSTFKVELDEW